MKKIYLSNLVFILAIIISKPAIAQTIIFEDQFDSYTVSGQVSCQNPADWKTWRNVPCSTKEDPLISNAYSFSGANSVVIKDSNDLVRLHSSLKSGICKVDFQIYLPAGKTGYFNSLNKFVLGEPDANHRWAFECYLKAGGNAALTAAGSAINFTYTYNSWHPVQLVVDLDKDSTQLWFDGNKIHQWQWTKGYGGAGGYPLQLDATNLFGASSTDEMYVDDFFVTYSPMITSKLSGGDWNTPSTWNGDIVPLPGDPVKIISGSVVTLDANVTLNTLAVVSGTLNCKTNMLSGSGSFILASDAFLGIGSASGITSSGNSGNIQVSGLRTYSTKASYIYNGTVLQNTGDGMPAVVNNLSVNNSAGLTFSNSELVSGNLTLISGLINTTNTNLLTIGASATISGGSSSSFINGPMAHIINTSTVTGKTYPIGKGSDYRPISLTITQGNTISRTYSAEAFNSAPTSRTLPSDLSSVSTVRYWNVTQSPTAAVTSASILLNYGFDDGVTDVSNLRVAKQNGTAWVNHGGTGSGSPSGSIVSSINFIDFSDFILANATGGTNPLPVELTSFNASTRNYSVLLTWSTATEVDNYGFEIERTADSKNWVKVGFVNGHGNSNSPKNYSFEDNSHSKSGSYHYRLKQLDTDGGFSFSNTVSVLIDQTPNNFKMYQNYPNPFNPSTKISWQSPVSGWQTLKVYNILGNEVATLVNEFREAGSYEVEFSANGGSASGRNASQLTSGVYIFKISAGNFSDTKKMLLTK